MTALRLTISRLIGLFRSESPSTYAKALAVHVVNSSARSALS